MATGLFRKAALEKLSTPDQLDKLIVVTKPRGWMALMTIAIALATALVWGIFGTISYKISGTGMLIKTGGLFNICSKTSGNIVDLRVEPGDMIREGMVIARIDQRETLDQISDTRDKLIKLNEQKKKVTLYNVESINKQKEYLENESLKLIETVRAGSENLNFLKEKLSNQKTLFEKGLITKDTMLSTKQQINNQEENIASSNNELKNLEMKKVEANKSQNSEMFQIDAQIKEVQDNLKSMIKKYDDSAKVVSNYSGKVVQVPVDIGKLVRSGEVIATVELVGKNIKELELVAFIPIKDGKLVNVGMDIRILPTMIKKEEDGFMLGKVTEVSEYPVTSDEMTELFANDQIVSTITKSGAVLEVKADLINDPSTISGFKWSTEKGPAVKIRSGTLCDTLVSYKVERPINLVIPLLKKWSGIY